MVDTTNFVPDQLWAGQRSEYRRPGTVKQGQNLAANTVVMSDAAGKWVIHDGVTSKKVAGILIYAVDATAADAAGVVYKDGDFISSKPRAGTWFVEGLSPRAGIAVLRVAKARALMAGRDYVAPDDVQMILPQTIAHRLVPLPGAGRGAHGTAADRALLARRHVRARRCGQRRCQCQCQCKSCLFHFPPPLFGCLEARRGDLEPDGLDHRTLQLAGVGRIPLVERFLHGRQRLALQTLGEARGKAALFRQRIVGVVGNFELHHVGQANQIGFLDVIRGLRPVRAIDQRHLGRTGAATGHRQCQAGRRHDVAEFAKS